MTEICWACDGATDEVVHTCGAAELRRRALRVALVVGYLATIVAANAALERWGLRSVGFGLVAPAGVYFAALALTLRDLVRERSGRPAVAVAIAGGAALSFLVEPRFALASAVAFAVSEVADSAVYEPLRRHGFIVAAFVSGVVGAVIDSALFVELADLGGADVVAGLVLGKLYAVAGASVILAPLARRALPRDA